MAEQTPSIEQQRAALEKNFYVVIRGLLSRDVADIAYRYTLMKVENGEFSPDDPEHLDTPVAYGDTLMDTILERTVPVIEPIIGEPVFPTVSFMRVYQRGGRLLPHVDRYECEVSMTVCLGYDVSGSGDPDYCWPIFVEPGKDYSKDPYRAKAVLKLDEGRGVRLKPGDAILYYGTKIRHWRNPYPGTNHSQVFLHYVRQNGLHANHRFDFRPRLGAAAETARRPQ